MQKKLLHVKHTARPRQGGRIYIVAILVDI